MGKKAEQAQGMKELAAQIVAESHKTNRQVALGAGVLIIVILAIIYGEPVLVEVLGGSVAVGEAAMPPR